jgi:Skp family chaperone for outer membrane proteins
LKHIKLSAVLNSARREAERVIKPTRTKIKQTFRTKRNRRKGIYIAGAFLILSLTIQTALAQNKVQHLNNQVEQKKVQLQKRQEKLQELHTDLQDVQKLKADTDIQLQQKAAQEAQLKAEIDNLNAQLQAKAESERQQSLASKVVNTVTVTATASADTVQGCGDNFYANYIYMHESTCKTHNPNGSGCDGIGQACPSSKVIDQCGYDYACQNAWFTNYANSMGGWEAAYNIWLSKGWW